MTQINSVNEPVNLGEGVEVPQYYVVAFVLDDAVQHVISVDARFAAILLSSPTVVEVTDIAKNVNITGWKYDAESNSVTPPTDN